MKTTLRLSLGIGVGERCAGFEPGSYWSSVSLIADSPLPRWRGTADQDSEPLVVSRTGTAERRAIFLASLRSLGSRIPVPIPVRFAIFPFLLVIFVILLSCLVVPL